MSKTTAVKVSPLMKFSRSVLGEREAQDVAGALQHVLVDLIDLGNQVKQAHWAVIGASFTPVHEFLDTIAASTLEAVDATAERMTALNATPDGRIATVAERTELEQFPIGPVKADEVVKLMADRMSQVISRIRGHEAAIRDTDAVTSDLLIGFLHTLEKQLWMLQAQEV